MGRGGVKLALYLRSKCTFYLCRRLLSFVAFVVSTLTHAPTHDDARFTGGYIIFANPCH